MRQGKTPQEACRIAIERIVVKNPFYKDFQVALLALNEQGVIGSYCFHPGFSYVVNRDAENKNIQSGSYL